MTPIRCTLLIDDDLTTNFLNRKLLERMAVSERVRVALNGREGLELLGGDCVEEADEFCPALIFLDVNMPVMNGFEFLDAYKQLPLAQRRDIVIVILTTSLHPRDVQRVDQLPVAAFLNKPLTAAKVTQILETHFG